jgi:hypothetical protein
VSTCIPKEDAYVAPMRHPNTSAGGQGDVESGDDATPSSTSRLRLSQE